MSSLRPGTVDYAKFDSIGVSDSSSDEFDSEGKGELAENLDSGRNKSDGIIPPCSDVKDADKKFRVTLHPDDDGQGLHPVFLKDARNFVPCEHGGYSATFGEPVRWRWGLPDEYAAEGIPNDKREVFLRAVRTREMQQDNLYRFGELRKPQEQFVSILVQRKRRDLRKARERREKKKHGQERRDLVLHVYLVDFTNDMKLLQPDIYRQIKISSGLKLSTFADKILTPLMGWARNYHSYCFTDLYDGAMWCPQEHGSNDGALHFQLRCGGEALKPSETVVGELLRKVGDKIAWVHDLGDHFTHIIEVEEIIKGEPEADGRCIVLGGAMRCPPEDCGGCREYQDTLDMYYESLKHPFNDMLQRERSKAFYDFRRAPNVLGRFDPEEFDLAQRQKAVSDSLRSRISPLTEPKTFVGSGSFMGLDIPAHKQSISLPRHCKPGQIIQETPFATDRDELPPTIMSEVINVKPDPRDEAVCVCGNPSDLAKCSRCGCLWYCSKECQAEDWRSFHKKECKVLKLQLSAPQSTQPVRLPLMKPRSREKELRFTVGTKVECQVGNDDFRKGRIVAVDYREPSWPQSKEAAPYQVLLNSGLIWVPIDDDAFVRRLPVQNEGKSSKRNKKKGGKKSRK